MTVQQQKSFTYDVALSFLSRDLDMAKEIYEGLRDRLRVFYYPEYQGELVGTYGDETLTRIFRYDSKLDVILYRDGWGKTDMTVVEERAIHERGFKEHDYDKFLIVLVVGQNKEPPGWLPSSVIWLDPLSYGMGRAITIIETRLRDLGSDVRPETARERAARIARRLEWDSRKNAILNTHVGVARAHQFANDLLGITYHKVEVIKEQSKSFPINAGPAQGGNRGLRLSMYSPDRPLDIIAWYENQYANSLRNACLTARLLQGNPRTEVALRFENPKELATREFLIDLGEPDEMVWREDPRIGTSRYFSNDQLAEELLSWLMEQFEVNLKDRRD